MKHLLTIEDLERADVGRIVARAESFAEVGRRDIKKVPTLRGRTVVNLFYESSTRTSSSFELAAKRLSADVMSIKGAGSSVDKGESLKDTILTLDAYDPDTGQHLWHTDSDCRVPVPMATSAGGVIYTSRGYNSGPYLAIRPGGRGDVTATHVLWRVATGAPYVSSALHYQGLLYLATEVGVVRCVDPKTGETIWTERIGGNFSASPIAAEGRIYLLNEEGETIVLEAGRKCVVLARNALFARSRLDVAERE